MATANIMGVPSDVTQLVAPDIATQQMQLARRQQMADLLRNQSLTPMGDTQMVGGWAIKKSPLEGLGKLAQALGANYAQNDIDTKNLDLAKALQGRLGDILGGGSGNPGQPMQMENRQDPSAMGPQPGVPVPGLAVPAGGTESTPFNPASLLRSRVIGALGGDQASGAYWKQFDPTELQRNDRYLGITPGETRQTELAKRLKEGTQTLLPGQTNVLPTGQRIVAPNFETGVAGGFDANGQPVANEIPGSAMIAANRAGGIKRAEAGVADVFAVPAPVDAATGRVALTPAQQRAAANGGVDPANPRPVNPMKSQLVDSDRQAIFQGEMKQAQARLDAAKTPEEKIRAQNDIDGLNRETQRLGIKLQDDASRKFSDQVASKSADSLLDTRDKAKAAADSLIGIQKARSAIGGGTFQGSGAETKLAVAKFINANIPGVTIDPEKVSNTDYLKSTLGASLLAEAKTLGSNPSNADATRINDIVGSITKDPGAMAKILDWRQEMAERSIKNHNSTVDDAEKRGMTSPYDLRVKSVDIPKAATSAPTTFKIIGVK